jgi:peptidoglycan/LPS O-acetylase OafA/YrhL
MKELTGITGLRFLAALYVVLFHIYLRMPFTFLPAPAAALISVGALGVQIFFVLSGFVLVYSHLKDFAEPTLPSLAYYKRFMFKRVARIYPAYLVGLLLYWVATSSMDLYPFNWLVAGLDATLTESYSPALSMQWYGGASWSISTEVFFYLTFPVLLPLLLRIRSKNMLLLLVVCSIIIGTIPGLYYALHIGAFRPEVPYTFPLARLPEFVCGMLLGILMAKHSFRVPEWVALLMLAVTALYLAKFGTSLRSYTANNFIAIPTIMALICVLVNAEKTRFFKWLGSDLLVRLGRSSYSFYIVQIPLLVVLQGLLERKVIQPTDFYIIPVFLLLNTLLAKLLYKLVEDKAHSFLLSKFLKKPLPPVIPSVA